ncbi:AzlC family ABC transporter permease [Elioraea tepidiphila]|jgi:4-azaleucine resistance transporter AzlC|uniref:AzlC family ABC transporter permease n=1 Tax=Elioraea tepidiphila TaxID=457934 RepID=UPI002FDA65AD
MRVIATGAGFRRGARATLPLTVGLVPFGLVVGVLAQAQGLSALEQALMSALVFAGSSQILALELWTDPAPIASATLAALAVNVRFALMGPSLAPWIDALKGVRKWATVSAIVDHAWALAIAEMRAGRHDALFYLGSAVTLWSAWLATTILGHALGAVVALPRGHPLFFAAPACFIALLVPIWRGRGDAAPWAIAAAVSLGVGPLLPNPALAVVSGAVAGSLAGALRETAGGAGQR